MPLLSPLQNFCEVDVLVRGAPWNKSLQWWEYESDNDPDTIPRWARTGLGLVCQQWTKISKAGGTVPTAEHALPRQAVARADSGQAVVRVQSIFYAISMWRVRQSVSVFLPRESTHCSWDCSPASRPPARTRPGSCACTTRSSCSSLQSSSGTTSGRASRSSSRTTRWALVSVHELTHVQYSTSHVNPVSAVTCIVVAGHLSDTCSAKLSR